MIAKLKSWATRLRPRTGALAIAAVLAVVGFFIAPNKTRMLGGVTTVAYGEAIIHHVGPLETGRIRDLRVQVGQRLQAGDVIATLDDTQVQLRLVVARAELAEAEAAVDAAHEDELSQVIRGELLVLRTKTTERAERAELAELSRRMQRLDGLLEDRVIPAGDVEEGRERERSLEARIKAYDQSIGRGEAWSHSGNGRSRNVVSALEARVGPYRQAVEVKRAVLRELEYELSKMTLRAPVNGTVSLLAFRPGDVVKAGDEVVAMVSSRPGVVVGILPERIATTIDVGMRATLRRDRILSGPVEGKVIELSPIVEEVPVRARPSPHIPAWGRRVVIQLTAPEEVVAGEAFHVTF